MHEIRVGLVAAALTVLAATQARADFHLEGRSMLPATPAIVPDRSPDTPARTGDEETTRRGGSPFKVAYGFGNAVPLSFATKQIVPHTVTVRYGRGIDPNILVSWKGGGPWNRVLATAIQPLQLRLVMGTGSLLIAR